MIRSVRGGGVMMKEKSGSSSTGKWVHCSQ